MVNYDHFLKKSEINTPYNNVLTVETLEKGDTHTILGQLYVSRKTAHLPLP